MMPNKRLLGLVPEAMRYILRKVLFSWLSLAAGIVLWFEVGRQLQIVKDGGGFVLSALLIALSCIALRFALTRAISSATHKATARVKTKVRGDIYAKLRRLGPAYNEQFPTAEVVQLAGEGVEQLESYFGNYIPQFFYAMLAPLTLGVLIFTGILFVCAWIAGAATFRQGFWLAFGLMVWIGVYDTCFLDWVLFANLPMFRLDGTEHMDKAYHQKWFHVNAKAEGVSRIAFQQGDATHLDFPDETFDAVVSNYVYHNIPGDRQSYLLETLRTLKKGGTFALHDIFSKSRYGDMQAFVKKLRDMGYQRVELIDTTDGKFMKKSEAAWMALGGSALLTGRK